MTGSMPNQTAPRKANSSSRIKDFARKKRKGGKLDVRYVGPFVIVKSLSRGVYQLVSEDGKSTVRATGAHLKPYNKATPAPSFVSDA